MKLIAHRGNINGRDLSTENTPDQITACIKQGYDVEVDIRYDNGKLLAHCDKKYENIDIFVLVTAKFYPTVVIRGWAKKEQLVSDDKIGGIGYGKAYLMEQDELNPIDLLCFKLKSVNDKKIPKRYPDNSKDDLSGYRI